MGDTVKLGGESSEGVGFVMRRRSVPVEVDVNLLNREIKEFAIARYSGRRDVSFSVA